VTVHTVKLFLVTLAVFGILDAVWLGVLMRDFYRSQLWPLARTSGVSLAPLWTPVVLVYLLLAFGTVTFVLPRAAGGSPILWGAAFGLVVYGVYDLTNFATLRGYTPGLTVIDIAWGMTASAIAAWVVVAADRWLS
jgi:uncharacterized membrane protein